MPIPGNKSVVVTYGYPLLLGVTQMADGYNFAVEAEEDSDSGENASDFGYENSDSSETAYDFVDAK